MSDFKLVVTEIAEMWLDDEKFRLGLICIVLYVSSLVVFFWLGQLSVPI